MRAYSERESKARAESLLCPMDVTVFILAAISTLECVLSA